MLIASFDDGTVAGVFDRTKNTPRANEMGEIGKANYSSLWFAASRSNGLHGKSETVQLNPPGTLASVRRGGMAEKTAKCEAYVKRKFPLAG